MNSQNWIFRGTTYWVFGHQLSRLQLITLTVSGSILVVIGIIGMMGAGVNIYYGIDSKNWVERKANIQRFEAIALKGKSAGKYKIVMEYNFQFDGKTFVSDQIRLTDEVFFEEDALKLTKKCEGKSTVMAFINPMNPTISVIERGVQIGEIVLFILTLFAFLCGVWFFKVLYFKP
ncbi:MAG: DUF3592 domain-containing protein [Chloroherpetonaceae bacterium]|nr:DUF3592 domain-containing protein [Chloroherpetonaceae bacterium]